MDKVVRKDRQETKMRLWDKRQRDNIDKVDRQDIQIKLIE